MTRVLDQLQCIHVHTCLCTRVYVSIYTIYTHVFMHRVHKHVLQCAMWCNTHCNTHCKTHCTTHCNTYCNTYCVCKDCGRLFCTHCEVLFGKETSYKFLSLAVSTVVCACVKTWMHTTVLAAKKGNLKWRLFSKRDLTMCVTETWMHACVLPCTVDERWGAGVETQKNVRGEIGGWGRVPFNETYAPSLSTIYDGA